MPRLTREHDTTLRAPEPASPRARLVVLALVLALVALAATGGSHVVATAIVVIGALGLAAGWRATQPRGRRTR